jgi:uncharacterized membrane protein
MSKYLTPGTVTAFLSIAAIIAGAFGKGALETFLNDPSTAQTVLTLIGSIGTLVAGILAGVKKA